MERDGLQTFIAQTNHRILTREEERRLSVRIQQGDKQALDDLVLHNVRLVYSIARRWMGGDTPLDDLIQFGMLGLIRAAQKFDGEKGFKFSTYATWWIVQAIDRGVTNCERTIRLPISVDAPIRKLAKLEREAAQEGRDLSDADAADLLDLTEARVRELRTLAQRTLNLEGFIGPDGDVINEAQAFAVLDDEYDWLQHADLRRAFGRLTARQRAVVTLRHGLDGGDELTFDQIGERFGTTRSAAQQIHARALASMRTQMQAA